MRAHTENFVSPEPQAPRGRRLGLPRPALRGMPDPKPRPREGPTSFGRAPRKCAKWPMCGAPSPDSMRADSKLEAKERKE